MRNHRAPPHRHLHRVRPDVPTRRSPRRRAPNVPHVGPTDAQPGVRDGAHPRWSAEPGTSPARCPSVDGKTELRAEALTLNPAAGPPPTVASPCFTAPRRRAVGRSPAIASRDATPTRVHGLLAPQRSDGARAVRHRQRGRGHSTTWGRATSRSATSPRCLPARDGEPVEGTIEACIDVLGTRPATARRCKLVSTVPGTCAPQRRGRALLRRPSAAARSCFTLPGVSGAAPAWVVAATRCSSRRARHPRCFCVTEVTHQPSRSKPRCAPGPCRACAAWGRCDEGRAPRRGLTSRPARAGV
jgi:hypothetical protein